MALLVLFMLCFVAQNLAHEQHHKDTYTCPANTSCFKRPATCTRDDCDYYMTVEQNKHNPDQLIFDIQAKTDGWVAIGFSEDMLMGNDDVLMCIREARTVTLVHSWNNDRHANEPSRVTFGYYSYQNGYTYINGNVRCQFIRDKIILPGSINWVDMESNQYHFLFASGPNARPAEASKHTIAPCASTNKVDLTVNQPIEACPKPAADDNDDDDAASLTNGCFLLVLITSIVAVVFKV